MKAWFQTLDPRFWLLPDDQGLSDAAFILKALRLQRGHRVLDAPCGAGRIAVHLARAGCAVTGVDLEPSFIRRARARFRREGLPGSFKVMDLRDLDFVDAYHGICNWFSSFGYFEEDENLDVLHRFARALHKNGRLVLDQINREYMLRNFSGRTRRGRITAQSRWDPRSQRILSRWSHTDGCEGGTHSSIRLYTPGQMKALCARAGLTITSVHGSILGERYRRSSTRMIFICRAV